jgi:hypothetical protein
MRNRALPPDMMVATRKVMRVLKIPTTNAIPHMTVPSYEVSSNPTSCMEGTYEDEEIGSAREGHVVDTVGDGLVTAEETKEGPSHPAVGGDIGSDLSGWVKGVSKRGRVTGSAVR